MLYTATLPIARILRRTQKEKGTEYFFVDVGEIPTS